MKFFSRWKENIQRRVSWSTVGIFSLAVVSAVFVFPRLAVVPSATEALQKFGIKLGLDLQGGARLEYEADTSSLDPTRVASAMDSVQGVVERRVNAIGVGEPRVQQATSGASHRIVVEIPGVSDIREAKDKIKDAPMLDFRERSDGADSQGQKMLAQLNGGSKQRADEGLAKALKGDDFAQLAKVTSGGTSAETSDNTGDIGFFSKGGTIAGFHDLTLPEFDGHLFDENIPVGSVYSKVLETTYGWHVLKKTEERFVKQGTNDVVSGPGDGVEKQVRASQLFFQKTTLADLEQYAPALAYERTGLTGQFLTSATVDSGAQQYGLGNIAVNIHFNDEGAKKFEEITARNVGKPLAIFIDDQLVTAPTVQGVISGGTAQITGKYTMQEAKDLAKRLNEGALPVPLRLVGEDIVSPTLGKDELDRSIEAGVVGLVAVVLFVMVYYRLPGVIAGFALVLYSLLLIAIFKLSGVSANMHITLTLSGIAGFLLSIGMAIDANILIFERMKEELRAGKGLRQSAKEGFRRAWTSIRDSNSSTILTCVILIGMGTGFVQGFALVLMLGVFVSLFSAISVTRVILFALPLEKLEKYPFLFLGKK